MRYAKTLGVVAIAVTALMASSGVGSASAATTLCKANENPCAAGNTYGMGTNIEAKAAGEIKFEAATFNVSCKQSELKTSYEDNSGGGNPTGKVSTLTFAECGKECTAKVLTKGSVEFTTEGAAANGNGVLNGVGMELTVGCGAVSCVLTTAAGGQGVSFVKGGNPAKLEGATVLFWKLGDSNEFLCGREVVWKTNYEVTNPKPLFVQ